MADFNPRSHEGSDHTCFYLFCLFQPISIHAPTRGATRIAYQHNKPNRISIHAPTRGATRVKKLSMRSWQFQSTLPRGERPFCIYQCSCIVRISIHAPTRGATSCSHGGHYFRFDFNPRSHEGSDIVRFALKPFCIKFQSTLPRGERQIEELITDYFRRFQSTLPRGERR